MARRLPTPPLAVLLAAGFLAAPLPTLAQTQGRVVFVDSDPGRVVVDVLDAPGSVVETVVTDPDGAFELQTSLDEVIFRVRRPGFVSAQTPPVELRDGVEVPFPRTPLELSGPRVHGTSCTVTPEPGTPLSLALEHASIGLRLAAWSETSPDVRHDATVHERDFAPGSRLVIREVSPRVEAGAIRITNASDPTFLASSGYMVEDAGDDGLQFFAPDPETLLSPSFRESHCWRLRSDGGDALVGVAFEPAAARRLPDVGGVIWLEAASARLLAVEFGYRHLDFGTDVSEAGGRTIFATLPDGTVAPVETWLRLPVMVIRQGVGDEAQWELAGIREQGVRVHRLQSLDETWALNPGSATLRGSVWESTGRDPLQGARVRLNGTEYEAYTDTEGRFEFTGMLDGIYTVSFEHPDAPAADFGGDPIRADLRAGRVASVEMRAASLDDAALDLCQMVQGRGSVVLTGQVTDSITGEPLAAMPLSIRYRDGRREGNPYHEARISTGAGGEYVYCDAPAAETVRIKALVPGHEARDTAVLVAGRSVRTDLVVPFTTEVGPGGVFGTILDWTNGDPVEAVEVQIEEQGLATVSNRNGFFQFESIPAGIHVVSFSRIGYQERELVVRLGGGGAYKVDVHLAIDAIPIEGITVTAVPRRLFSDMVDLQHRMELGGGEYITRQELETRGGNVASLLQSIAGAELVNESLSRLGERYVVFRKAARLDLAGPVDDDGAQGAALQQQSVTERCYPAVYIDGRRFSKPKVGGIGHDPVDVSRFLAVELEAIEVYKGASTVPGEFGAGGAACGAIVLWTKRGLPVSYSAGGQRPGGGDGPDGGPGGGG